MPKSSQIKNDVIDTHRQLVWTTGVIFIEVSAYVELWFDD